LLGGVKSLERKTEKDVDDIIDVIRRRLEDALGAGGNASRKIRDAFQDADLNNDRVIDKREFKKVMDLLGVKISSDEVRSIYSKFDRNGDGSFNYAEFLKLTGYDENQRPNRKREDSSDVDDIIDVIRRRLEDALGAGGNASRKIRDAFQDADLNNSNSIDKREFKKVMGFLSVQLTGAEIKGIYDKFDRNGDGTLNYSEFLNFFGFETSEGKSASVSGAKKSFRRG
jgi:calmodulin